MQNTTQIHATVAGDIHFEEAYRRYSDVVITALLENKEQSRRLADTQGEAGRKLQAAEVARLIEANRPKSTVTGLQGLYERGTEYAQSLVEAGTNASHVAYDAAQRGMGVATKLGHQVMEMAHEGAVAAESALKSSGISDLVDGAIHKVSNMVDDIAGSVERFVVQELEEAERVRRLGSSNETQAILNARATSSLIKAIGFPFYNPTFEPNASYGTVLLEELERSRRIWQDASGKVAIVNAHELAEVVKDSVRLLKTSGHLNIPREETKLQEIAGVPKASRLQM